MEYSESLKKAVAEKDVSLARAAVITAIGEDARLSKPCALALADDVAEKMSGAGESFYETDNEGPTIPPREEWNEDYWHEVKVSLHLNFSRERIQLATDVMLCLREKGDARFQPDSIGNNRSHGLRSKSGGADYSSVAIGAGVGATIGALAGHVLKASIIGTSVAGLVVGGLAVIAVKNIVKDK